MPGGDHTGPTGLGPGTGRTYGFCHGNDLPGYTKQFGRAGRRGFGMGMGWGRGRGFRGGFTQAIHDHPWNSSLSRKDEIRFLKEEADSLKRFQMDIEKRLEELEKVKE